MATPFFLPDGIYTSTEDAGLTIQVVRVDPDGYVLVKHLTKGTKSATVVLNTEVYLTQIHNANPSTYWTKTG